MIIPDTRTLLQPHSGVDHDHVLCVADWTAGAGVTAAAINHFNGVTQTVNNIIELR